MHRPAVLVELALAADHNLAAKGVRHDGAQFACLLRCLRKVRQRLLVVLQRAPLQEEDVTRNPQVSVGLRVFCVASARFASTCLLYSRVPIVLHNTLNALGPLL